MNGNVWEREDGCIVGEVLFDWDDCEIVIVGLWLPVVEVVLEGTLIGRLVVGGEDAKPIETVSWVGDAKTSLVVELDVAIEEVVLDLLILVFSSSDDNSEISSLNLMLTWSADWSWRK